MRRKNGEEVMTGLFSKLLVTTALLSGPASADTLTIGYWDQALGGGVTPIASSPGTTIQLINPLLGTGFGFGQFTTLLIPAANSGLPNPGGTPTFETAWNNGFVPPQGGTIRLYGSWQGALTSGNPISLPTIFQTNEMPGGTNGFTVAEQVFICGAGQVFCDNFAAPGRHVGWHGHLSECTEDRFCHLDRARSAAAVHDQRGLHIQPRPLLYSGFATRKCRRSDLDDAVRPGCCAWTDRRCRTAGCDLGER